MSRAIQWRLTAVMLWVILITMRSCTPLELYEKSVALPAQQWKSDYRPVFAFNIKDTTARYEVSLVLRHRDRYHYNNIWLRFTMTDPQGKNVSFDADLPLGTNENGWLGAGMDDIYEHRLSLQRELLEKGVSLRHAGAYRFSIEQLMREDPLEEVMNVGIRVEKKP